MISPNTPRGTKVVCIDATPCRGFAVYPEAGDLNGLELGSIYTVDDIEPFLLSKDGFQVILCEIRRPQNTHLVKGFSRARFRVAELPKCLTALLNTAPIRTRKTVGAS